MEIIDTHCHLIYRDRHSYPWLSAFPPLDNDFVLTDYLPQAKEAGITKVIHMEVDVDARDMEAETEFVATLGNPVVAAIAACRPEKKDFAAYLDRVDAVPFVRGLRRVLHTQPDELADAPRFAENLRLLAGRGLTFDLCVLPRQLPAGIRLAQRCPDVQFVLDHCGIPNVKDGELDPWRGHISELAALANVACKISGVVAYADAESWTADDLRPFVEHCIDAFGWDRVVWGSDWPVCTLTADLARWVAATHELIGQASADERARLLSRNAERIYRLT